MPKDINELLKTKEKYKNAIIQKNLKSKKNTVIYVTIKNKPRVLKWFVPGLKNNFENEYNFLIKAKNKLNIPQVYEKDELNNVLILNYIMGENLCDIINNKETSFSEKERLMSLLSKWYYNFHNFTKKGNEFTIHGDSNLRNFVFTDRLWGLDFEEVRKGNPSEDISDMCASILTTNPMFTKEKFKLASILIDRYIKLAPGRITNIKNDISYSLLKRIQFRPDQEELLRKHSKKIKDRGLI